MKTPSPTTGNGELSRQGKLSAYGWRGAPGLPGSPLLHLVLIGVAGFLIYFNTLSAPFIFDDDLYLVHNPVIKEFAWFTDTGRAHLLGISEDIKHNVILRPVAYLTFALNYAVHGLDVRGYHLSNMSIHIINAQLVYLLLTLLFQTPMMARGKEEDPGAFMATAAYLPLFCALLFVCHPLQTQGVTYIIQRFTSLVTLFCLGSLVFYLYARTGKKQTTRNVCYLLSAAAAILAMKTKENAFTLPIIIAFCEGIFFEGSLRRRVVRLIPFLLLMVIIPVKLMELSTPATPAASESFADAVNLVNFRNVSSGNYLMTQFGVIATYLRLLVLPIRQNFDYDYPLQSNFFSGAVLLPLGLLLLVMGTGIYLYRQSKDCHSVNKCLYRIIAFGIFWFFIALAVDSSFIPIDDLIFEHRAYLPSIGFFMASLAGVASLHGYWRGTALFASGGMRLILTLIIICLALASMVRNRVWRDKITFWSDVAAKSPNKSRVHKYLGIALFDKGRTTEGLEEFRTAKKLSPGNVHSRIMLGKALLTQRMYREAAEELLTAIGLAPKNPLAHVVLGEIYEGRGDLAGARRAYLAAISIAPAYPIAHQRLGEVYEEEGQLLLAIEEFEIALQLYPYQGIRKRLAELKERTQHSKIR